MGTHKEQKFKKFAIRTRKKVTPGVTNAPTFAMQKKRARIYNTAGKRTWRNIDMGKKFKKTLKTRVKGTKRNVGKINPHTHRMHKKKKK